ncbi:beta-defensin 121 isoform X1 [Alexandromys fortis]|uniref:beta-defensin 121 isoform X1 n=1 Tax=Alexandromys fortis TaxID=100897 RepID=UPI00215218D3|nr:beta-defensin 119 isoform X1 [Microtus fortis]
MKLLLLLLAIFVATELVMSDECWKDGHCRVMCKDGEDSVIRCQNRKRCCVPLRYLTLPTMVIDGVLGWTTPTTSSKLHRKKRRSYYW